MERVNWQRTRDILISVICIGIILWYAWGLLLGQFVHAVVLLLLSMAVAFLLTPAVNFVEKQVNLPRAVATLTMYVIVLLLLGGLAYALVFSLIQQVVGFSDKVVAYASELPTLSAKFQQFLVDQGIPRSNIESAIAQIQDQATAFAQTTAANVLNIAFVLTNTFIDLLLILVLSFYFTLDGKRVRNNLISITPKSWMPHVSLFEDALNRVVGNYIRGQLTLAVIIGILSGVGCAFLGLSRYALIIGVLAFLFETIPMVGPALAALPAILLSLLLPDPFPRTIWIIVYFIMVQMVESNILGPRIVGHAVGLHPVASILALIIGAQLFGAFGALLATPIVAAAWVVIASIYHSARGETADQIMSNRRQGWVIRRPNTLLPRRRRVNTLSHHTNGGLAAPKQTPQHTVLFNTEAVERDREPETQLSQMRETTRSDSMSTQVKGFKGSSMPLEHIDLLRPVPEVQQRQPGGDSEEE